MIRKKPEIEKQYLQPDSGVHMAMAFRSLAEESSCMALVSRYETRLSRMYDRAYRTLLQLQRQAAEPKKQKAEPEPPEPPKPNGSNQITMVPERTPPSEPEAKNDETNPSTGEARKEVSRRVATRRAGVRAPRGHRVLKRFRDEQGSLLEVLFTGACAGSR
jgi:outer membrane biosynthesis protein TonB